MPWTRVLCVAEKPSISRSITGILSGGQFDTRSTGISWVKNYEFSYSPSQAQFIVTCVAGHITEKDFAPTHRAWSSCDPAQLFDAPLETRTPKDKIKIKENLANQARNCQMLVIWTDCDREGEAIGAEVAAICLRSNPTIVVKRARFSAIIAQHIHRAAQNLVDLDTAQADAVEARIALDLRIGAAFTRMQTLSLQRQFPTLENLISYGPCQFPTLGFVVSRHELVQSFVPELFWYIYMTLSRTDGSDQAEQVIEFSWSRGRLFEFGVGLAIYEGVLANPIARVSSIKKKPVKKWKPLPLTTVELQKSGSRLLKLAPKKILDIADGLYQKGFLSYPRTETDQFDAQFDFQSLIQKQIVDASWGAFAAILQQDGFSAPRRGKKNDQAHPPIHPIAHVNNLIGDDMRVYEYVTRRFLACCSKDAEGFETIVNVVCGEEEFSATGLVVINRHYLDIFPYDKWNGKYLPDFQEGEVFMPAVCELREGRTTSPSLLTEADLVGLMDKNGIGTDATIAQHIQTIIDREYVMARPEGKTKYLIPSTLGIALVEGYNSINFDQSLSKPQLRRDTERSMLQVCQRTKSKHQMLSESIEQYKEVFARATAQFHLVISCVRRRLAEQGHERQSNVSRGTGSSRGVTGRRGRAGRAGTQGRGGNSEADGPSNSDSDSQGPPPSARRIEARHNRHRVTTDMDDSRQPLSCLCGVPAIQLCVTRETANKGRKFWSCGKEKTCNFFEWVDPAVDSAPSNSSLTRIDVSRRQPAELLNGIGRRPAACTCDMTPVSRIVTKDGPNKGRKFWVCPNSENARCGFFEWDQNQENDTQTLESGSDGRQPGSAQCFKCGTSGHFAQDCSRSTRAAPGSALATSLYESSCFKCGQAGHWSSSCPNSTTNPGTDVTANHTPQAGACFKCGAEGHWSNSCPLEQEAEASSRQFPLRGRSLSRGSNKRGGTRGGKRRGRERG